MNMVKLVPFLLLCSSVVIQTEGSHVIGGNIAFMPTENTNEVMITYSTAINKVVSSCGSYTEKLGHLECLSGCNVIGDFHRYKYYCVQQFSSWLKGENHVTYQFDSPIVEFIWDTCCWHDDLFIGGFSDISAYVKMDLSVRDDTMKVNSSPETKLQILKVQSGCPVEFKIPVSDKDGDIVKCRWSVGKIECEEYCKGVPGAVLDEDSCLLKFTPTIGELFAVAIQLEDYPSTTATEPLSSVPLQFLVQTYSSSDPCDLQPTFVQPTPKCGSKTEAYVGKPFTGDVVAESGKTSDSITAIDISTVQGMTTSPFSVYGTNQWGKEIMWLPGVDQIGTHTICYTAEEDTGKTTNPPCCLTIIVKKKRCHSQGK